MAAINFLGGKRPVSTQPQASSSPAQGQGFSPYPSQYPGPAQQQFGAAPTPYVLSARSQGMQNSDIVSNLSSQGFAPEQINDAMHMAEAKSAAEAAPFQSYGISAPPQQPQQFGQRSQFQSSIPPPPSGDEMPAPPQYIPDNMSPDERIEELAEAIIDEKWKELSKNIDKIIAWKERTEGKIMQLEQQFADLQKDFESLHSAVLGKISEYDSNIVNLGSEIKALEKVFQKLLPTFTENVGELSRITKKMGEQVK